ncbi:AAA family ATPase [Candidatus Bathyarchaeota archaeon]|nr:AAA family ATPase [Candidatus Bathyarchaeota archaeon]MBL7080176.1 AAA family ATPase [Candidatus Bathyarchaeota archaeon]
MKLTSFVPRDISLSDDFVGFPLIHQDLSDIVKYLGHLKRITHEGKDDYKRMLIAAESGSLFLGRTGAGKTHALHCVVNEAIKLDYTAVDGSLMLGKTVIDPIDVREFFDSCKAMAEAKPLLIVYDDARQLLGSRRQGMHSEDGDNAQETRPMLSEFRRQIDGLQYYDNPAYIIVTSATHIWHIDRQIARRFSRYIRFPRPEDESRKALTNYYLDKFGHDPESIDVETLSFLTDGVLAGKIEEIVSKASYKADMDEGKLTNKHLVMEIIRYLQGPPSDTYLTHEKKINLAYHESGGHTFPAYAVGLEPILVTITPSADGTYGKNFHRHSETVPPSSAKFYFANVITGMGSTAIYQEMGKSREEGRMGDLTLSSKSALELYALKNPLVKMTLGSDDTYLSLGLFSEENRMEIEGEIQKIKDAALTIARNIIRNYRDEITTFAEAHLLEREIMVRSEILQVLGELGVEPGHYHEQMCDRLKELEYPV